mmetsp:Transcript_10052/g.26813  ORF Transcript_10052/g.26813 Transcript_10052/m.26813 type:complete len:318 (-) Transcript_10052:170-1123(-)
MWGDVRAYWGISGHIRAYWGALEHLRAYWGILGRIGVLGVAHPGALWPSSSRGTRRASLTAGNIRITRFSSSALLFTTSAVKWSSVVFLSCALSSASLSSVDKRKPIAFPLVVPAFSAFPTSSTTCMSASSSSEPATILAPSASWSTCVCHRSMSLSICALKTMHLSRFSSRGMSASVRSRNSGLSSCARSPLYASSVELSSPVGTISRTIRSVSSCSALRSTSRMASLSVLSGPSASLIRFITIPIDVDRFGSSSVTRRAGAGPSCATLALRGLASGRAKRFSSRSVSIVTVRLRPSTDASARPALPVPKMVLFAL